MKYGYWCVYFLAVAWSILPQTTFSRNQIRYQGETLQRKLERAPLALNEVFSIATQIAEGLARAHQRGIIHRDIKPNNIFVTTDGVVKILDFGLAKLAGTERMTRTGTTVGTVGYMSPEQARGDTVDTRTDLWSLGVVLYEALAGRPAFGGEHPQAVIHSILNDVPPPIGRIRQGVSAELEGIVEKAMAREPGQRYQTAEEILVDPPSSEVTRGRLPARRQRNREPRGARRTAPPDGAFSRVVARRDGKAARHRSLDAVEKEEEVRPLMGCTS